MKLYQLKEVFDKLPPTYSNLNITIEDSLYGDSEIENITINKNPEGIITLSISPNYKTQRRR